MRMTHRTATPPFTSIFRSAVALCLWLAACGGPLSGATTDDGGCPRVEPDTCPTPVPGFASQVNAIIQSRCSVCHSPGGQNPDRTFTTYATIYAQRSAILDQSSGCRMPPVGSGITLSLDERVALLGWLVCGAPMN